MVHIKRTNEMVGFQPRHIKVDDFFDISSISRKDITSISTDLRVFFQVKLFDSNIDYSDGEHISESIERTLTISEIKRELRKLKFKRWQISSEMGQNGNRIAILYADIAMNTDIISQKMESFGWECADISDAMEIYGVMCRVMTFDPSYPQEISDYVFGCRYIYHWTPKARVASILSDGIEPRSENEYLKFKPKAHLMKENVTKRVASNLGWQLYNRKSESNDGEYCLLRIAVNKIPSNVKFYGDTRCGCGITTKCTIPPEAITVFGKIEYKDKQKYHNEKIIVLVDDDTMNQ